MNLDVSISGVVEEQKGVYFPRGTFIDVALKNSPKQELKDVYNLAVKLNSFIEYQRKYFSGCINKDKSQSYWNIWH